MKPARLRMLLGLAGLALAAAPALAQPYPPPPPPPPAPYPAPAPQYYDRQPRDQFVEFRVWGGEFLPSFHDQFWNDNFKTFTGSRNDFQDFIGGGDFVFHFDRYNALMVSASFYQGSDVEAYRDFLDQNNNQIFHRTTLDISSGTVAYTLYPAGPRGPVIPYLGAGVGIYGWRLHQVGDFIDSNNNIFGASAVDSGTAFGYLFLAGLEIPVTRHVALLVDGRYTVAHANLGGDFNGFGRLDLTGGQVTGGIAFHL
jgi:opacity protein-like surface antigen